MIVYVLYVNWEKVGLGGRRVSHSTSFRTQFAFLNVKGNGAGGLGVVGFSAHETAGSAQVLQEKLQLLKAVYTTMN